MRKMNEILDGLEGVFVYMDDIILNGKDMESRDNNLKAVLTRLDEVGLWLAMLCSHSSDRKVSC